MRFKTILLAALTATTLIPTIASAQSAPDQPGDRRDINRDGRGDDGHRGDGRNGDGRNGDGRDGDGRRGNWQGGQRDDHRDGRGDGRRDRPGAGRPGGPGADHRGDWHGANRGPDRDQGRGDWRDYRRSHRDVYRRGAYAGPSGYRYRPVSIGYRFAPGYYSQRYWISDYGRYRLPAPSRYSRWVRYGNDAVLVNLHTGRVVTVYNGFFW